MPRPKKKPAVLLVVGILNLVIGLPCFCCMGFAGLGLAMQDSFKPPAGGGAGGANAGANANNPFAQVSEQIEAQEKFMRKEVAGWRALQVVMVVIALVYSLGLVISGIGLIMGQAWGRWMCIGVCAVMLTMGLANGVWRAAVVLPAQQRFADEQAKAGKAPANQGGFMALGGITAVIWDLAWSVGYTGLVIGLLMTGPVRKYFAGGSRRDDDFDDGRDPDRDRDDYDRRRDDNDDDRPRDERRSDDDRFRGRRDDYE